MALSDVVDAVIPVPEKVTRASSRKLVPLRTMDTDSPWFAEFGTAFVSVGDE